MFFPQPLVFLGVSESFSTWRRLTKPKFWRLKTAICHTSAQSSHPFPNCWFSLVFQKLQHMKKTHEEEILALKNSHAAYVLSSDSHLFPRLLVFVGLAEASVNDDGFQGRGSGASKQPPYTHPQLRLAPLPLAVGFCWSFWLWNNTTAVRQISQQPSTTP